MKDFSEDEAMAIIGLMKLPNDRLHENSQYYKTKKKCVFYLKFLIHIFDHVTGIPSDETRTSIAALLLVSPRNIQLWFQNRRRTELKRNSNINHEEDRNKPDPGQKYRTIKSTILLEIYLKMREDYDNIF